MKYVENEQMNRDDIFIKTGYDTGVLVSQKDQAYGCAVEKVGKILQILYPDGIRVDQMLDASLVIRTLDKICRIAHDNDPFNESPYRDITGYGIQGQVAVLKKPTAI